MNNVIDFKGLQYQQQWKSNYEQNIKLYHKYIMDTEEWINNGYFSTLYKGYPFVPINKPVRNDMNWYVDPNGKFGTWVVDMTNGQGVVSKQFGWSCLVRRSIKPIHEPFYLSNADERAFIAWIVDESGYGQYGRVLKNGQLWVPSPNPMLTKAQ